MFKALKKAAITFLVILGILFIFVMLWPEDEASKVGDGSARETSTTVSQSSVETSAEAGADNALTREIDPIYVGSEAKSATVMIYMNGSDLETQSGEASTDISEMIASGIGNNVNVVIQTMGTKKWNDYGISAKTAQTYSISDGKLNLVRDNLGQLDSTSAATLSEFIDFSKKTYPAERYIFLFWNHGGGPVYGFGYDEWQGEDDSLTIDEMASAFAANSDVHFDIIGMDCCIMASMETCYALAPYCKYALLSEDFESGLGWSYTGWMKDFEENPGISTTLLGKYIIDSIISDNENDSNGDSACMGLFNVATSSSLYDAWKAWAYKNETELLKNNYSKKHKAKGRSHGMDIWDYFSSWISDDSDVTLSDYYISDVLAMVENIDNISDEAKALTAALKASVAYYGHTSDKNELTGLAVSLPYGDDYFYDKLCDVYGQIGFDSEYIDWLGKFVSSHGNDSYYDYDDFSYHWGGWGGYEEDYGWNSYGGGYGQYSWDGWDDWDDSYYGCDDEGYADDWVYDYESELWYLYEGDTLYLYDDETNTMYYYDEDTDEIYYYDDATEEWYLTEE
ncbi:MAG: hypothetical protein IK018_08785 [Lachnospiraceae bacterium]|nr:hypothetical protein [Lachnospiraceae bacterium]MBR5993888.1 hypothetical protein [Lachnospiraceae bacterium]